MEHLLEQPAFLVFRGLVEGQRYQAQVQKWHTLGLEHIHGVGHQGIEDTLTEIRVGAGDVGHITDNFVVAIDRVEVDKADGFAILIGVEMAFVFPIIHFHRANQETDFVALAFSGANPGFRDFPRVVITETLFHRDPVLFGLVQGGSQNLLFLAAEGPFAQVDAGFAAKLGAVEPEA